MKLQKKPLHRSFSCFARLTADTPLRPSFSSVSFALPLPLLPSHLPSLPLSHTLIIPFVILDCDLLLVDASLILSIPLTSPRSLSLSLHAVLGRLPSDSGSPSPRHTECRECSRTGIRRSPFVALWCSSLLADPLPLPPQPVQQQKGVC
jgi:hypothetical protein